MQLQRVKELLPTQRNMPVSNFINVFLEMHCGVVLVEGHGE